MITKNQEVVRRPSESFRMYTVVLGQKYVQIKESVVARYSAEVQASGQMTVGSADWCAAVAGVLYQKFPEETSPEEHRLVDDLSDDYMRACVQISG